MGEMEGSLFATLINAIASIAPYAIVAGFLWPLRKYLDSPGLHDYIKTFRGKANLKALGAEAAVEVAVAEQQQAATLPNLSESVIKQETLPMPRSPATAIIEDALSAELNQIPEANRIPILLRALADTRLRAGHESTYNRIFGSQIAALKLLNERGAVSVPDAVKLFEPISAQYPEVYAKYGFEGWSNYLTNNGLVEKADGAFRITPFGRDFLLYLVASSLTESKPL